MSNAICQYISSNLSSPNVKLVWAKGNDGIALCHFSGKAYLADVDMKTGSVFAGGYPKPVDPLTYKIRLAIKISAVKDRHTSEGETITFFEKAQDIRQND